MSSTLSTTLEPESIGDLSLLDVDVETTTTWLQPFVRSWEALEEDENGRLKSTAKERAKQRKLLLPKIHSQVMEKGIIRVMTIICDGSAAMNATDLRPNRRLLTLTLITHFISDFFDANPLAQLSILIGYKGVAIKVTELSGNPLEQVRRFREKIQEIVEREEKAARQKEQQKDAETENGGEFSLYNCLEMARQGLDHSLPFASREILLIMGALSSVDAHDVHKAIAACKMKRIICTVIHLAAELYLCTELANQTGGKHHVVLHKAHFEALLRAIVPPSPLSAALAEERASQRRWMRMAFPSLTVTAYPLHCSCHTLLTYEAYTCPQCCARYCELPTQCIVCSLHLVSAPQLARTYHHLFPTPAFDILEEQEGNQPTRNDDMYDEEDAHMTNAVEVCAACQKQIDTRDELVLCCPQCQARMCLDCDEFVHLSLNQCPLCLSHPDPVKKEEPEYARPVATGQDHVVKVEPEAKQST